MDTQQINLVWSLFFASALNSISGDLGSHDPFYVQYYILLYILYMITLADKGCSVEHTLVSPLVFAWVNEKKKAEVMENSLLCIVDTG